jgi:hypothetical protein
MKMKWTKVRAGVYRSGKYELRQAKWRASNDGWLIATDDDSFHDSTRLLSKAKRRCETHAADEAKKATEALDAAITKVDLLNASPQLFCETLFLAAKLGVGDAMANRASRSDHDLAALLCERGKYRYEHVRMLHEAYESGHMFMELRGQPTNMTFADGGETPSKAFQAKRRG